MDAEDSINDSVVPDVSQREERERERERERGQNGEARDALVS